MRINYFVVIFGGGGLVAKSYLTLATPWTVSCQAHLSMEFSSQEYWSWLPLLLQGIFLTWESNPVSPAL